MAPSSVHIQQPPLLSSQIQSFCNSKASMGCCFRAAPSSSFSYSPPRPITVSSAAIITATNAKLRTILCCRNSQADSTSSKPPPSYSQKWFNPRRKQSSISDSDLVRHWVTSTIDIPLQFQDKFTVVSYNILGDRNAFKHRDMYRNVPLFYLKWEHRKRTICQELIEWDPDIICLQEVDKYYDLMTIMEKVGYLGSYKRRTGDFVDGCATFWRADKFHLLEGETIEFNQFGLRDNVAQLSVLEMCKDTSRRIIVGNIHVLYNPRRGDVKLGQIRFLASRAHLLSKKWGGAPVVLAGDYNSTPQSAVYNFLLSSELNIMLHDRRDLSGQKNCLPTQALGLRRENGSLFVMMDRFFRQGWTNEEVKTATGSTSCRVVVHPLKLNSSYATVKGSTITRNTYGEPLATSYHSKFLGTVDYLWYSNGLVPTKVLDTLPLNILKMTGGLPCEKLGSDHLALVSEFAFQDTDYENRSSTSLTS